MSVVPANQDVAPAGSRALGVRVKPIIRLGMGRKVEKTRKDGSKVTFPEKTDHFTVRGDQRAVAKFRDAYGEQPKAIDVMLPGAIDQALTIQYRAFKGGQSEDGGALVAVGHTNFALRDWCGGPDVLTVWDQDGTVRQVETAGLDAVTREPLDDVAKEFGIELYTMLRAGMPKVLGFGAWFELSTKGKESTDNLWARLREWYGALGSRVTFALEPVLVIRSSSARPVVVKDGKPKRIKTTIYVADLVSPEPLQQSLERLRDRQQLLAPQGAEQALYGPPPVAQIGPGDAEPEPDWEDVEGDIVEDETDTPESGDPGDGGEDTSGQQAAADGAAGTSAAAPDPEPVPANDPEPAAPAEAKAPTVAQARKVRLASGMYEGRTLGEAASLDGSFTWFQWALRNLRSFDAETAAAIQVVAEHDVTEAWNEHVAKRQAAAQ